MSRRVHRLLRPVPRALPLALALSCSSQDHADEPESSERPALSPAPTPSTTPSDSPAAQEEDPYAPSRQALVDQLRAQGIEDEQVLEAIASVPRHRMVPEAMMPYAYADRPLPIGHDQTISQPYIVALMSQLADIEKGDKVLEIGTGSGYQAAVLAELGANVHSIEIVEPLARRTRALLDRLGYDEIETRIGDGYRGWPEEAPFDAILLTAAPPSIPEPLEQQLEVGGKLVAPVGERYQELVVVTRTEDGFEREEELPVRFVPMTGVAQR